MVLKSKDYFSSQANSYAKYRPTYPKALYDFLFQNVNQFETAWDCGCGNGQVSVELAKKFKKVIATDISQNQISHALKLPNINYKVCHAEASGIDAASVDLITVGQALHWFNFEAFFKEVKRVAKPHALLVAWTYTLSETDAKVDSLIKKYYNEIVGSYWAKERSHVDAAYSTISFPFNKLDVPKISIQKEMTAADYVNYLETWSASATYFKVNNSLATNLIKAEFFNLWPENEIRLVTWPLAILAAQVD